MNTVAWTPVRDLMRTTQLMDQLFSESLGGSSTPQNGAAVYRLPVDVLEQESGYAISASVPGFTPDQVEVTFHEGVLTIQARAEERKLEGRWIYLERPYGSFARRLQLPDAVAEGITASFDSGVLTINVPKAAKAQPVRIPVGGRKQLAE